MVETKEIFEAIASLPMETIKHIQQVPPEILGNTREVRLRAGRKICLDVGGEDYFLPHTLQKAELFECFRALCGYSIHTHAEEIKQGYVTVKGGHRAGLCGTAVYNANELSNLRNISSINLRVARQIPGAADKLIQSLNGKLGKALLVGPPASGKTTLLKDLIRQMKGKKVAVIDSRGELGACLGGVPQNDVGDADIFDGWKKADGMMAALRTMAPDIIVCDEIGDEQDMQAVQSCMNAGAELVASAHAGSTEELLGRRPIMRMLRLGAFENVIMLKGKEAPCQIDSIHKAGDLYANFGCSYPGHLPDVVRLSMRKKFDSHQK